MLGGPLRYLEHVRKVHRKFSRGLWKKKFQPKKWGFVRIFQPDFELHFFKISILFHFSWHIIRLVCRMVTIFLLTQRARLSGPFRYLEHVRQANRKFSRGLWKKFQPKKWGFVRIFQPDFELHFFKIRTFCTFPYI